MTSAGVLDDDNGAEPLSSHRPSRGSAQSTRVRGLFERSMARRSPGKGGGHPQRARRGFIILPAAARPSNFRRRGGRKEGTPMERTERPRSNERGRARIFRIYLPSPPRRPGGGAGRNSVPRPAVALTSPVRPFLA